MFAAIAGFAVKFRWPIIVFWIALVPIFSANFPSISSVTKNQNSDFLPKNSPGLQAVNLERQFQPKGAQSSITAVVLSRQGPLTGADEQAINRMMAAAKRDGNVQAVQDKGVSSDGQVHQFAIYLSDKAVGPGSLTIIKDVRRTLQTNSPTDLETHLAGPLAESADSQKANKNGKDNTTIYTVIFILALLLLVFRAVLAPLVTLLPAGLALVISQPLIAKATSWGIEVSFITEILLIVLLLGAGTDYGLFLVFRVREELRRGLDTKAAVVEALTKVGESITFSAATVTAALLCLLLASFGIYSGLGPALAIGLVVMLLIALTFLPALLAVLGRAVFWPSKTGKREQKIGWWGRVADSVIKRPVAMIVLGIVLFTALSLGIIGYKTGGFGNNNAPVGSDSAQGDAIIARHFGTPASAQQLAILHFPDSVLTSVAGLKKVQQAQQLLDANPAFKGVAGPFNSSGLGVTPTRLLQPKPRQPGAPVPLTEAQFISKDGKTVQFFTVPTAGKSGSTALANATPAIRSAIARIGRQVGADKTALYSADSIVYDINTTANHDLKKIIPVVLVVILLLLAILLRSLVAPWYLIITVALSYLGSLGFAMYVFVHWLGQDGLNFVVPFMLFIFSMALGEDYNILVMSRIREETRHFPTLNQSVTKAIGVTGTTVTSAGLILAGTFGVLGLVGGNTQVEQIGYSIAFGILLDTFFVRTLLVPSIVTLFGKWNWWPAPSSKPR